MSLPSPLKGESLKIILLAMLGWTFFSCADVTIKILTETYSPAYIISIGAFINFVGLTLWISFRRGVAGFKSQNTKLLIARGIIIGIVSFCVVNAFARIPLADVYGITFTSPFITVVFAALFLREHVGWHRWLAIIVGFIGVIVLAGPQFETLNEGIFYAALASIMIALGVMIIRKIGKQEYLPLFFLYPFMGMLVINLPMAWNDMFIPPIEDFLLIFINATCLIVGTICTTYAFTHAQTTASIAPFVYIQAIWGVVFGYFLFNDTPTGPTLLGLAIIITAGLYMIYQEKQLNNKQS